MTDYSKRKSNLILCFLVLILLPACSVKKKMAIAPDEVLINNINQLIDCLNSNKLDCVQDLYSPQFNSFSPVVDIDSVSDLVETTVSSMAKNNYLVAAEITELELGANLAYVRLNWRMVETDADGTYTLVLDDKRLDIWRFEVGDWKLYRSLFYKEFSY